MKAGSGLQAPGCGRRAGVVVSLVLVMIGCSGSAVCGNGVTESGEACDLGSRNGQPGAACSSSCNFVLGDQTALQVRWTINQDAAPMFTNEPCFTVTGSGFDGFAAVSVTGPSGHTDELPCGDQSKVYKPVPAGTYMVTVKLLERMGTMAQDLTQAVTVSQVVTNGLENTANVNFPTEKFLSQNYAGNLFFQTGAWVSGGGDAGAQSRATDCQTASVAKVRFWLKRGGTVVLGAKTDQNLATPQLSSVPLDGSAAVDCYTFHGAGTSYMASALPWGKYDLTVGGYDGSMVLRFCSTTSIFVGAGGTNPTYQVSTSQATGASCM